MDLFNEFLASGDTLRVYDGGKLIFASQKEHLLPLMEYSASPACHKQQVTVFDKVIGNAAALLAVKVNCREACSPLGSELAMETLVKYGISYHFVTTVPYIRRADGKGMCPMERLSLGKGPEEFYEIMRRDM